MSGSCIVSCHLRLTPLQNGHLLFFGVSPDARSCFDGPGHMDLLIPSTYTRKSTGIFVLDKQTLLQDCKASYSIGKPYVKRLVSSQLFRATFILFRDKQLTLIFPSLYKGCFEGTSVNVGCGIFMYKF